MVRGLAEPCDMFLSKISKVWGGGPLSGNNSRAVIAHKSANLQVMIKSKLMGATYRQILL